MAYLGANTPVLTPHFLPHGFFEGPSPTARIIHLLMKLLSKHCSMLEGKLRLILTVAKF